MSPVFHNVIVVAPLLSFLVVEAARPESSSGDDVVVALQPNHYHRLSSKSFSSAGRFQELSPNASTSSQSLSQETNFDHENHGVERHAVESQHSSSGSSVQRLSASATKIHVVAITNHPDDERLSVLKRSLLAGGFSIDLFHYITGKDFTWTQRLLIEQKLVQEAVREDPEAVFLFIDAFDVISLGRPEEILGKFHQTGKDVLFSCVTYPYPHQCKGFDWKEDGRCNKVSNWGAECPHWCRFACAGAFMGKARVLAQIFFDYPPDDAVDDQCYFNMVFAQRSYNIAIDYRHEIFFSTADLLQCALERKGGRIVVTSTGTLPSVIHFDATHPSAEHLELFWKDALQNRNGPLCVSNASCTNWCWDWDFGDMPARLTASDGQVFDRIYGWNPFRWHRSYRVHFVALGAVSTALLLGIIYACSFSKIEIPEIREVWKDAENRVKVRRSADYTDRR